MSCYRLLLFTCVIVLIGMFFIACEQEKPTMVETDRLSGPELMAKRQAKLAQSKLNRTLDPNGPQLVARIYGEEARAERMARMLLAKSSGEGHTMATQTHGCWRVGASVREVSCAGGFAPLAPHFCLNMSAWSESDDEIEYIDVFGDMFWRSSGDPDWNFLDSDLDATTCGVGAEISNTYDMTQPWCGKIESNHLFENYGGSGCQITQACNTGSWLPSLEDTGCAL